MSNRERERDRVSNREREREGERETMSFLAVTQAPPALHRLVVSADTWALRYHLQQREGCFSTQSPPSPTPGSSCSVRPPGQIGDETVTGHLGTGGLLPGPSDSNQTVNLNPSYLVRSRSDPNQVVDEERH